MASTGGLTRERESESTPEISHVPALRRWSRYFDQWVSKSRVAHDSPLDSEIAVVSPENIAFKYRVAGFFPRSLAFLIDVIVTFIVITCLTILFFLLAALGSMIGLSAFFDRLGMIFQSLMLVLWFVLYWFYSCLTETWMNGQTLGKRWMGLRVLTSDGGPISGSQAALRGVLRAADCLPWVSIQIFDPWILDEFDGSVPWYPIFPTFLVAIVAMALTSRYQRLGDIVCGTMVVRETKTWGHGLAKLEDPRVPHLAEFIPPGFVIGQSLAQALAAYVDRRRFFSVPRRREIAAHLAEPLLEQFGLPEDTGYDLFLCALYYRAFIADQGQEDALDLRLNPERRQFEGLITQQLAERLQGREADGNSEPATRGIHTPTVPAGDRLAMTSSPMELGMAFASRELNSGESTSMETTNRPADSTTETASTPTSQTDHADEIDRGESSQEGGTRQ